MKSSLVTFEPNTGCWLYCVNEATVRRRGRPLSADALERKRKRTREAQRRYRQKKHIMRAAYPDLKIIEI